MSIIQIKKYDTKVKFNTEKITLFFSEDIKESALTLNAFSVSGFTITDIIASSQNKTVVLTIEADADNAPSTITMTQNSKVYDISSNLLTIGEIWKVILIYTIPRD